jgi:hypothetical protein
LARFNLHIIIIGGGISGIAAAWELRKTGAEVTLLESRPRLGGRLTSHHPAGSPTPFDNGPHLFLSTYTESLKLFRELRIADHFVFPYPGRIHVIRRDGLRGNLGEWPLFAPFNLAAGLVFFNLLSWKARSRILRTTRELISSTLPPDQSAETWLAGRSESEEREIFWQPLIHAALNAPVNAIPASHLGIVFKQGFCRGWRGGRLGYATKPLDELFGDRVKEKLESAGVQVRLKTSAWGGQLTQNNPDRITGVFVGKNEVIPCDEVVVALPPWALAEWASAQFIQHDGLSNSSWLQPPHFLDEWQANPIVTIYLWADERPLLELYTSLPGRSIGWVFDYGRLWNDRRAPVALMLEMQPATDLWDTQIPGIRSWTRSHFPLDSERIFADLFSALPQLSGVRWKMWKIIRERRATPLRPASLWGILAKQTTAVSNLYLAGDWLDPELPPTVEAAVRTGIKVGKLITGKE